MREFILLAAIRVIALIALIEVATLIENLRSLLLWLAATQRNPARTILIWQILKSLVATKYLGPLRTP